MKSLDWRWTQIGASKIPSGRKLVLKMWRQLPGHPPEASYAIATYDENERTFSFTARENPDHDFADAWMALPDC